MMNRTLTFTFALLCCLGMQAQEFCLKPVLGGNVSTLTGGKGKGKTEAGAEPAYVTKLERSSTGNGKPDYKHFIVGVPIGLRLALKRTDICLRYTYGLTDVCQDNHSSTFSFLLAFTLGK